jgi:hypothetical protein
LFSRYVQHGGAKGQDGRQGDDDCQGQAGEFGDEQQGAEP